MSFKEEDVLNLFRLSKIGITDDRISQVRYKLASTMDMIKQIIEVNCEDTLALSSVIYKSDGLREDHSSHSNTREELFVNLSGDKLAFVKEFHYYVVPKVLNHE